MYSSDWQQQSTPSGGDRDKEFMMEQINQLQKQIKQLQQQQRQPGSYPSSSEQEPVGRRVLLVSNLPHYFQNCDAVYYLFKSFGGVDRVKILHNKPHTALVQMSDEASAELAQKNHHTLNKTESDNIYVNFSNNVTQVKMPSEIGIPDDGLTKDFTGTYRGGNSFSGGPWQGGGGRGGGGQWNDGGASQWGQFDDGYSGPPRGAVGGGYGRGRGGGGIPGMNRGGGMAGGMAGSMNNGPCLLVSNIVEELCKPDILFRLFGMYGDVMRIKVLRNKPDCCLIQMYKPHHATQCKNFLDQARFGGQKICVSYSRIENLKMPNEAGHEEDQMSKDFSTSGNHRFRNYQVAMKLQKNMCPPTPLLHIANVPETLGKEELRQYFLESECPVKDVEECKGGSGGNMYFVSMSNADDAAVALAKLHNTTPEGFETKNRQGLCISFSNKRVREQRGAE